MIAVVFLCDLHPPRSLSCLGSFRGQKLKHAMRLYAGSASKRAREERQTFRSPIATTIFTYLFGTVGRWRTSLMSRLEPQRRGGAKRHRPMRNVCNERPTIACMLERWVLVMELGVIPLYRSGLWERQDTRDAEKLCDEPQGRSIFGRPQMGGVPYTRSPGTMFLYLHCW
ncbi:hypothetical protein GGI42DRAFT_307387 [Trichoderma sp. SZMC 28013]